MPDYEAVMDGGDGYWVGKQGGETIMAVSVDISDMNTEYNAIRVVASLEQIQSTVNSYVWGVSALCAGVLLLLLVTGLYFIRSIVRPIKQINATTKKYAKEISLSAFRRTAATRSATSACPLTRWRTNSPIRRT